MARRYDLAGFARAVGKWPINLEIAGLKALRSSAARGVEVVVKNISSPQGAHPAPVDTGAMRSSVRAFDVSNGAILAVEAPHAVYVERGTKPHTPPLGPILTWVVRKIPTSSDSEAMGIALAIQRKIAEVGTEPRFFFRRSMREIRGKIVPQEMRAEFSKRLF